MKRSDGVAAELSSNSCTLSNAPPSVAYRHNGINGEVVQTADCSERPPALYWWHLGDQHVLHEVSAVVIQGNRAYVVAGTAV